MLPQLEEEVPDFILQQDGAPPHCKGHVRDHLNDHLPQRWIGCAGLNDVPLMFLPPRSPDLTPLAISSFGVCEGHGVRTSTSTGLTAVKAVDKGRGRLN
jgi:hypothetical protein